MGAPERRDAIEGEPADRLRTTQDDVAFDDGIGVVVPALQRELVIEETPLLRGGPWRG